MKFQCEKSLLEDAVQLAGRAVSVRQSLPILSHIVLKADGHTLTLSATDLETSIECQVAAEVALEGSRTLPARVLAEVVGQLPDGVTTFNLTGPVEIRCRQAFFKVNCMSAEEYPTLPQAPLEFPLQLPQRLLRTALKNVAVATASSEETRAVLQGVLMALQGTQATFVATDGRRLAKMELTLPTEIAPAQTSILPGRAVIELQKVLKDSNDVIEIASLEGQMFFRLPGVMMSTRLLEGKFPNYRNLLPSQFTTTVRVDKELLASAVRRALVMAQERITPKLVRCNFAGDTLTLSANAPDLGAASDEVPINKQGNDLEIAFNGRFFLDGLVVIPTPEVQVLLNEPASAALLKPTDEALNYLYLIMPVRIQRDEAAIPVGAGAAER